MGFLFLIMSVVYVVAVVCGIAAAVRDARFVKAQHHAWKVWEQTGKAEGGWPICWLWGCDHSDEVSSSGGVVFKVLTAIVHGAHVHEGPTGGDQDSGAV